MRHINTGIAKTKAYQRHPTRIRMRLASSALSSFHPPAAPAITSAATKGPSGFGPVVRPRASAINHGYQERRNARAMNAGKRFVLIQDSGAEELIVVTPK
jgi:hypothetical protein